MPKINFLKMSGAGNDFVIIDARMNHHQLSQSQIAKIADRKNIGCDQLVILKNSAKADVLMVIYNSDGSQSGACGNATRCVAALIMQEKSVSTVAIETAAGILSAERVGDLIAVNMGQPRFSWSEIPLLENKNTNDFAVDGVVGYKFTAVNMGNPHIVTFINQAISDQEFFILGPKLENHQLFPEKTNVEFVQILSPNHLAVRVWERGAGETLACGSGACAVAVAAWQNHLVKREKIKVSFKGGDLFIEWAADNSVIMSGGYQKIFSGEIDESFD